MSLCGGDLYGRRHGDQALTAAICSLETDSNIKRLLRPVQVRQRKQAEQGTVLDTVGFAYRGRCKDADYEMPRTSCL